jgi:3-hydroxymyristoyl/3-hydroxydecanoyl-(acyl carrier protein) dehydratase
MHWEAGVRFEQEFVIPAGHPSLPGHFPGRPIVPGVVILDEVVAALATWRPRLRVSGFSQVKFLAPLLPDQCMRVVLEEDAEGRIGFQCRVGDGLLATGQFRLAPRNT